MNRTPTACVLTLIVALGVPAVTGGPAFGTDANGFEGCTAPGGQLGATSVSDGAGGPSGAWPDKRPTGAAGGGLHADAGVGGHHGAAAGATRGGRGAGGDVVGQFGAEAGVVALAGEGEAPGARADALAGVSA